MRPKLSDPLCCGWKDLHPGRLRNHSNSSHLLSTYHVQALRNVLHICCVIDSSEKSYMVCCLYITHFTDEETESWRVLLSQGLLPSTPRSQYYGTGFSEEVTKPGFTPGDRSLRNLPPQASSPAASWSADLGGVWVEGSDNLLERAMDCP